MAVKDIIDALSQTTVGERRLSELVKDVKMISGKVEIIYNLPAGVDGPAISDATKSALKSLPEVKEVSIRFSQQEVRSQPVTTSPIFSRRSVPGIGRLIAVASGKGGVGKSTVATNIAIALSKLGNKVGLLDADIYGPSVPTLVGLKNERVHINEQNKLLPLEAYGLKVLSIGFLLPSEDTPVIWRGPMLMRALTQFLFDVEWGELDFLVLDLPPGTGDVQLTLAQNVKIDGAIIVTTPQDLALADVRKAVSMFKEVNIPILGVVENMAYFTCPESNQKYYIFGKGKVAEFALAYELKVLGSIPIDPQLCSSSDVGKPIALEDSESAKAFMALAQVINEQLKRRN
ncbi:MAG: Mrp/NBP35 family ATP-binding protein [Aquificaceae bacterium]|nr:Mrp/NBP35 family ATP-binding protein [Aquificaceae bacterium]